MYIDKDHIFDSWPEIVRRCGVWFCDQADGGDDCIRGNVKLTIEGRIAFMYSDGVSLTVLNEETGHTQTVFFGFYQQCLSGARFILADWTVMYESDLLVSIFHPYERELGISSVADAKFPMQTVCAIAGKNNDLYKISCIQDAALEVLLSDGSFKCPYEPTIFIPSDYIFDDPTSLRDCTVQMFIGQCFRKCILTDLIFYETTDHSRIKITDGWIQRATVVFNDALKNLRIHIEGRQNSASKENLLLSWADIPD